MGSAAHSRQPCCRASDYNYRSALSRPFSRPRHQCVSNQANDLCTRTLMRMGNASNYLAEIENDLGESWLPRIYRRVLKMRTRAYEFPPLPKNVAPAIHHTLLGIELKVGRHRMLCPELATER